MTKVAVVTGAGTGVGRATAIALARQGWKVAIVGRREETLRETENLAKAHRPEDVLVWSCDVGDVSAVNQMAQRVLDRLGKVEVLVNAAGTNVPKRSLEVLSLEDYHHMIDTNLNGAYYCVQAFLPAMRQQKSGTIINIVSEAGRQASPKAGPAYVMSKFGMMGLTQSINAEERGNGIRACAILPGDIDTPLLDKRPTPPPADAREKMLRAEDVAECALLVINLPSRALVEEIMIRPR
jgi:NAD(P)-dependent dehydrogenase (short-subunit alcohol dehydrogenase family)